MNKALIVGAGGNGGNLVKTLHNDIRNGQIEDTIFYVADFDKVEAKNKGYQPYEENEIGMKKVDALSKKYPEFIPINKKITKESQLKGFDIIISAVDNFPTRALLAKYCHKNNISYIDMRAYSRGVDVFSNSMPLNYYLRTINAEEKGSESCQDKKLLAEGKYEKGNFVAAEIGSQFVFNAVRGRPNKPMISFNM